MQDLVINVVAASIVFVFGVVTREVLGFLHSWRGRSFWGRRLIRGKTFLFIGTFTRFNYLEPSSFIGLGDSRALHEVAATLGKHGASFEIAYASRISGGQLRENMILLGLEETNSLTAGLLQRLGSGFRVNTEEMTITDLHTGTTIRSPRPR